ncbi:hypothetical protein VB715_14100 [Crocosphaera sp. UHCC 0190]|uniref:hypothetical protein n=1 Tax=Crocosphaera sp. UHCC 0190 TaxID=3110246 RepID=UPI002B1EA869|nr:hypothetical protein [Crocosphaera sp. UHCC 0190]MEA5510902.1 hypothetical protein [Crocosphaera sp. UHCC 0190]
MNNNLSFVGLASISFFSLTTFSANGQIPQTGIQDIEIEGSFNEVTQELNQQFILNFVYLPQLESSVIPRLNVQSSLLDNVNNLLTQQINQTVLDYPFVNSSLTHFSIDDFLNYDNTLNGVQYNTQQAYIEGENNFISQKSSQTLTDFFFLDDSSGITGEENFSEFLDKFLTSQGLDSLQFGLQDTFILGNNNLITQTISQTLNGFIFTDTDFSLSSDSFILDPIQFTIQETSIFNNVNNALVSENNIINQTINQFIGDVAFFKASSIFPNNNVFPQNNNLGFESNDLVDFDLNAFITDILNLKKTMVKGTQINRQLAETIGNDNETRQENLQVLVVSVPEPSSLKMLLLLTGLGIYSFLIKLLSLGSR